MSIRFRLSPPVIPEQEFHENVARVFSWLIEPPATWAFYPAGAVKLPPAHAAKLTRMGLQRGWPDFLVLYHRLYGIELKTVGGKLSKTRVARTKSGAPRILIGQVDRFPQLLAAGMADIAVCHTIDEVVAAVTRWEVPLRGRLAAPAPSNPCLGNDDDHNRSSI
jgi:hypothetical protein